MTFRSYEETKQIADNQKAAREYRAAQQEAAQAIQKRAAEIAAEQSAPPPEPAPSTRSFFSGTPLGAWWGRKVGSRRKTLRAKFDRCVKSVRKTVRARKGSNAESAAIAICTKTILHPRGKTLKRYKKGRLTTQRRKLRGGGGKEDLQAVYDELIQLPPDAESYTPSVDQQTIDGARAFVEQAYAEKQANETMLTKMKKFFGSQDSTDLIDFLKKLKTGAASPLGAGGADKASYEETMLKYLQA